MQNKQKILQYKLQTATIWERKKERKYKSKTLKPKSMLDIVSLLWKFKQLELFVALVKKDTLNTPKQKKKFKKYKESIIIFNE